MTRDRQPRQVPLFAVDEPTPPEAQRGEISPRADLGYEEPQTYEEALRLVGKSPPKKIVGEQPQQWLKEASPANPDLEKSLRDSVGFFFSDGIFKGATCLCAYDTLTDNEDTANILCTVRIKDRHDQAEVDLAKSTIIKFLIDQHWQHQNIKAA